MLTEQIETLKEHQRARLQDYLSWWARIWLSTEANDEDAVAGALERVYHRLGRKAPYVIWCDSPWQLAVAPFLMRLLCFQPNDAQRRLLRRSYDRTEIQRTIRLELARNLNEEMWARTLDSLINQLEPEIEYAFAHEAPEPTRPMIGIERALGLHIESVLQQAHSHLRRALALNLIEYLVRQLTDVSRPLLRAKVVLEQELTVQLGRRCSDFNGTIRGGGARSPLAGASRLIVSFIHQVGREFATHMARLLTEDQRHAGEESNDRFLERFSASLGIDPAQARRVVGEVWNDFSPEARLAHVMTDYGLTWGSWSQDFSRVYTFALSVFDDPPYPEETRQQLEDLSLLRMGAFMYVFGERVVFACKHPLAVRLDDAGRLHSYTQPAIEFLDGYSTYCWQGVAVPAVLVECPELLTVRFIEAERNVELRRVLIERYGASSFLKDSGAELIARDEFGSLYSKRMVGDEPLVMVHVVNSTPEPDGTFKDYYLRVPPNIATPREAIAWTFGMDKEEYAPSVQT